MYSDSNITSTVDHDFYRDNRTDKTMSLNKTIDNFRLRYGTNITTQGLLL